MMRIKTTLAALLLCGMLQAQTIEEGNKNLYYGRYQSAQAAFSQLVQQQPENGEAWLGLTNAWLELKQPDKAAAALAGAPAAALDQPLFLVAKGTLLLVQNKKDSAQYFLNTALEKTKHKEAPVLKAVAEAHIKADAGDAALAVDLLQKAQKREKRDPAIAVLLGDAYRKMGNSGEAYKMYQEAIAKDNGYARAHYELGDIFLSQKNPEMYLQHFQQAIAADPAYAPALEKMYAYEFARNPQKAKEYYDRYLANSDTSVQNQYDLADLLYISKEYGPAISKAQAIMQREGEGVQPRLYKMIGYSYAGMNDTAKAVTYMQQYFDKAPDSTLVPQDFVSMSAFLMAGGSGANDSVAGVYLARAVAVEKDSANLYQHYRKLADLATARKDYAAQAQWMHKYYTGNKDATNLDLFNTGLAYFRAENYVMADSVYGLYTEKYPDQSFGYYWRAKSKAMQDPEMKEGLAIEAYQKLVDVLQQNTADANYQKWMVEAYGYLAAYEANSQKDYPEAISYFEKLLEVDPGNQDAQKYIAILEKDTQR